MYEFMPHLYLIYFTRYLVLPSFFLTSAHFFLDKNAIRMLFLKKFFYFFKISTRSMRLVATLSFL